MQIQQQGLLFHFVSSLHHHSAHCAIIGTLQAKLVEEGARSHAQSTEEYYHAERDYTRAQHTVEEIEVRNIMTWL
jgi:hypothetical protein